MRTQRFDISPALPALAGILALALGAAACSSKSSAKPAIASDFLPLTEEPRAELPNLAYRPAHTDAEYIEAGSPLPVIDFYIQPLDESVIARRTAELPAVFDPLQRPQKGRTDLDMPPEVRTFLAPRLSKDPRTAARLSAIAGKTGRLYPTDVWPLEVPPSRGMVMRPSLASKPRSRSGGSP